MLSVKISAVTPDKSMALTKKKKFHQAQWLHLVASQIRGDLPTSRHFRRKYEIRRVFIPAKAVFPLMADIL